MMTKNLPFSETLWKIPLRMFLDAIAAYRALIDGDFSYLHFYCICTHALRGMDFYRKEKHEIAENKDDNYGCRL